ncbi:hypothetical protein PTTW11_11425 [Pyrenophora teres f. teres]|uniref:Uncharacterized protein n=1 Tax=Pyrenophora teres f. teres TaxID=97479 RepID=A0A6S6WHX5_9PLEO|nr:hypothetical protein PTTW11_11425 [Pyrenophora teres f. teres]
MRKHRKKSHQLSWTAHQARLPDRDKEKLQLAATLIVQLIESARPTDPDQRPLARLQNPESQATYVSYVVRFVCFYLRLIADEESRMNAYLARRDRAVDSASDEDAGTDSEYDDEDAASSNDNDSVTPQRRIRRTAPADKMKDARELFTWKGDQKALARELWLTLGSGDEEAFQTTALLNSLVLFILTGYSSDEFSSGLVQYLEEDRDAFLELRKKYLADGSYSPMSAMLSLLAYGKHAALNEGNAGNTYWSPDKKTFYLNGRPIVVERFCKMAQSMEAELEESFWLPLILRTNAV